MTKKQEKFTLLNGRVVMAQSIYNPTSDAVWLAAFVPQNIKTVLDVGIGTGGVSLCLLQHVPNAEITGIDISSEMLAACKKNMELNNKQIKLLNIDIMTWSTPECYDLVVTNPPYFNGTPETKHRAHHNTDIILWTRKSLARVKPNGYFCIIVDALVVDKVMGVLGEKCLGQVQMFPLFSTKNTAERVLIRARKGVRTGATVFQGTSMNNVSVLRDGLTVDAILAKMEER